MVRLSSRKPFLELNSIFLQRKTLSFRAFLFHCVWQRGAMERPVRLVGRLFDRSKKWFKRVTSRHQHPEDLPIAAVAPSPELENTAGEKVQLRFQIYSESAPRWNDAVGVLKTRHPKHYAALETMADGFDPPDVDPNHRLEWNVPRRIADDPESSEIIQRMKRLLPSLASLRGIVMAAAAIDPFKLAPVISGGALGPSDPCVILICAPLSGYIYSLEDPQRFFKPSSISSVFTLEFRLRTSALILTSSFPSYGSQKNDCARQYTSTGMLDLQMKYQA